MAKPIAVQLYSVRDVLAQDFEGVIRKIAAFGYQGVETAGFPGTTPQAAADLFKSLGLQVPSAHIALPLGDKREEVLSTMKILGAKYLVLAHIPREQFTTVADVRAACARLNEANPIARDAGLTLLYHNHWWEYQPLEGTYAYKIMAEELDPSIGFEIDTYWVRTGGLDPVAVLEELGARVPLLHIKDGPGPSDQPMVAVGEGSMDFPPILKAGSSAEWLIVELDRCATDMLTAVETSYRNLEKLANG
jgi:sugar phosphate isomerase/epimerase